MDEQRYARGGLVAAIGRSFLGVGGILVAESFGAFLLGGAAVFLLGAVGFREIPAGGKGPAILGALMVALALVPLAWVVKGILRPKVATVGVVARRSIRFDVATTHPSYVAIDLLLVPLFLFAKTSEAGPLYSEQELRAARVGELNHHVLVWTMCGVLAIVAVVRLVAWYGLSRRVDAERAWVPVAVLIGAAALVGCAAALA